MIEGEGNLGNQAPGDFGLDTRCILQGCDRLHPSTILGGRPPFNLDRCNNENSQQKRTAAQPGGYRESLPAFYGGLGNPEPEQLHHYVRLSVVQFLALDQRYQKGLARVRSSGRRTRPCSRRRCFTTRQRPPSRRRLSISCKDTTSGPEPAGRLPQPPHFTSSSIRRRVSNSLTLGLLQLRRRRRRQRQPQLRTPVKAATGRATRSKPIFPSRRRIRCPSSMARGSFQR